MAVKEGPLMKWTNVMKGWQYRWFVLDDSAGLLSYYTSKEKMAKGARRGCVRLKGAMISIDDDECTFTITVDEKMFHFQAQHSVEREKWIRALDDVRHRHSELLQKKWDPKFPVPTMDDFNKKLTETDAFLQIMINQVQDLETKIEKNSNFASQEQLVKVRDRSKDMLESIKHSIVLLQIAKNVAHPVNGFYQPTVEQKGLKDGPHRQRHSIRAAIKMDEKSEDAALTKNLPSPGSAGDEKDRLDSMLSSTAASFLQAPLDPPIVPGIEAGEECFEDAAQHTITAPTRTKRRSKTADGTGKIKASYNADLDVPTVVSTATVSNDSLSNFFVPVKSYSSSEDEDFYDAFEETSIPAGSDGEANAATTKLVSLSSVSVETSSVLTSEEVPKVEDIGQNTKPMERKIDFDAIYEDDEEEDLGSVEGHGSVISHLLSQVKLGMDLTKVVLPTFILERRSLLEMYADFFAHPDIFVNITDHTDPKDRMVQMVRWYLSAFHAGRKSSVAKKPYNPILGETFKCYFDVPGLEGSSEKSSDGPVPFATKGQLGFIAEQVSHHPPISAFYAEHYNKRITLCAHIWTKSKFLGLSIGVHMLGQGCVSLLDYDEEYILTFPNGYGRSILTVPWVELGGSTTITCAKTGYSANVEFLTKPFYGGKKHRITADVFQPNDKKAFLSISGEWNGVMNAKWADGRTELFVDTTSIPIIKKQVLPVTEQEDFESRRLWCKVTVGLRYKNIERATEAKFNLEQKQREEAKQRKENGTEWQTRVFHENGGNWIYDRPLQKRLLTDNSLQQKRGTS